MVRDLYRWGNRAAFPAPELKQKHPDSAFLFLGGTFEARSPFQLKLPFL
jgi:hypothetical protein